MTPVPEPDCRVLSSASNAAVLQMHGRAHPGVLIQGDSLKVVFDLVKTLQAQLRSESEAAAIADEVAGIVQAYLREYERVLRLHGLAAPYDGSVG